MSDQAQIALGLKEAVRRWCFPVKDGPLAFAEPYGGSRSLGSADAADLGFLNQLLLLQPITAAEETPMPLHLFQEDALVPHDWRLHGVTRDALTPNCCSGASTFRGTLGPLPLPVRGLQDAEPKAPEECHFSSRTENLCSDFSAHGSATFPALVGPQGALAEPITVASHLQLIPLEQASGPSEDEAYAGQGCSEGLLLFQAAEKPQPPTRCGPAPPAVATAAAAAAPATAIDRHKRQQQQQQSPPLHRQLRTAPTPSGLAAKGMKRRSEPLSRGASQAAVSAAAATGALHHGSPSGRAEGPPQKRQALVRRRGDLASTLRSNSTGSAKVIQQSSGTLTRRASSVGKALSGGDAQNVSSKQRVCSTQASVKAKQQLLQQRRQKQLQQQQRHHQQRQQLHAGHSTAPKIVPLQTFAEQFETLSALGDLVGGQGAADAAAAAAAVIHKCSGGAANDCVAAFASEWLAECEKRLRSSAEPPASSAAYRAATRSRRTNDLQRLQLTKKRLKQELKAYNEAFASHFGRQPLKLDKEPLRPVYMHYQLIKEHICQLERAGDRGAVSATKPPTVQRTPVTAVPAAKPSLSTSPSSRRVREGEKGIRKSRSSKLKDGKVTAISPAAAHRHDPATTAPGSPAQAKAKDRLPHHLPSSAWHEDLQKRREEMAVQLHQLQRERRVLGDKLAAYHLRFKQENGRPLRLKADIAPVQHEYSLFVETTKQIDALAYALQKHAI